MEGGEGMRGSAVLSVIRCYVLCVLSVIRCYVQSGASVIRRPCTLAHDKVIRC